MATSKPPYDPIKSIEGMFNGSVTRIAYMLKDPTSYGQDTKAVLEECSKKFQDALDDCEIQILDAKWYLENLLAQNKAKREARAKEDSVTSAKRKYEEIKEIEDKDDREDTAKRLKAEAVKPAPTQLPNPEPKPLAPTSNPQPPKQEQTPQAKPAEPSKPQQVSKADTSKPQIHLNTTEKKPDPAPPDSQPQSSIEEFPKPTPQVTPSATNDEYFVSMFGEPSGEGGDDAGTNMNFDLDLGADFGTGLNDPPSTNMEATNSLSSLLPGLESYVQMGDDNTANNNNNFDNTNKNNNSSNTMPQTQHQQQQIATTNFDLPNLGHNDFDDFLNSNDFDTGDFNAGGGGGGGVDMNMGDDGLLNMEGMDNLDNLDFDSMFN